MAVARLAEAVQDLGSGKPKERLDAADTIKNLLGEDDLYLRVRADDWDKIILSLVVAIKPDKESFLKKSHSQKADSRVDTTVQNRLKSFGQLFRDIVELAGPRLEKSGQKAIKRAIELVADDQDEGRKLCMPLSAPLLRLIRFLLCHKPYREQLTTNNFEDCLALAEASLSGPAIPRSRRQSGTDFSDDEDVFYSGQSERRSSQAPSRQYSSTIEDLELSKILGLLLLCGRDWLPLRPRLERLFRSYFASFPTETPCHPHILAALNQFLYEATPNAVENTFDFCHQLAPVLLRLWDSRTLGVRPELVQFFRIFTTLSRALVTGKSASPEPKHAKTQDLFAKLWARLWAEVHSKQQYFEPWNVSFTAYAALWTDSSSSLDFKITMAIVNENDHRTWMFLDLMATCLDLMPEEFSKDKGARAGTAAATSPIEQICNGIMEARGVPQLLVLQLAYAWLARGGKNDTLDLIGLAQCLVDAISYEDSETTAWILLSLGTLCRTMCKEPSRRATDVYRRLGAICLQRLNSPQFSDAAAHMLADLLEAGFVDSQDLLSVNWLEGSASDPTSTSQRLGTGLWRYHRARISQLRLQASQGSLGGDVKRHIQAVKQMTSTGIQRLVSAIVNSRPEGWALLNIECLLFEQELVRTWETMLGLPWRGTLTGLRIGAQAWELRLRELKLALRVLDQGLDVHAGQPTAVEQTARILRSGDVLSFLHALQTAVKDVLGGSKPTPLKAADLASQHERRRSSFVKAWPLGVLIRIRAALLLADFGPEVERSSIEATIAGGLEACSAYISTDLNFRIGSEELEASVCVLQAFAWSLLAFPFYSQYTQLTDRLGSLAMGRVDDRTVMPLLSLETASVSHLMEIMRSILAGTSDEFEGLGKRKRTLDHDFEGPGSQTDGERLSWDVSAGQLVTMWFASTGDGTLGSPALRNLRFYAIAICRQLGTCFRSHDHSVSEALVDDLINVLQPVSGYDGANALDAIDSMIVMANMVSDVHARRLLETMASILSDNFSVLEDPWSLVVILRGASLLLRTVGSDSPVLDDVSKFLSEIIRVMKARLPKGAKKHLHYRGRLELGVFLSNACLAYRDPSSLIESWDSTTIINLVTDDYFQVRISTIRNVPSLFSALQQDVMFLVRWSTGDFEAISREARITHAILLTLLAQSAPELAGEATARIVQIPDLHHFIALSLRRLAVAWHYSDEHQLAKDFLSSLLFFWLTAGQDLAAFPIQQLGYGVAKDFLQEHGVTVVAQLWVTGQVSQLRFVEDALGPAFKAMLENAIPVTVALVLPHSDGDKAEVESRLSVLRKKLDPKVFERNIRSEIDVTLATMLAHCAAGDDETDGEVPEPEATALRDLKVAVSDAAAKPSTNVMPIYTWRQTLRGIHVLRTLTKEANGQITYSARIAGLLDRLFEKLVAARAPVEVDRLVCGIGVLLALSKEVVAASPLCVQITLQMLAETADRSPFSSRLFCWLLAASKAIVGEVLSRVLYTVSSSIAALEPEPLARSSLYECAQAVLHSGAELDPLAVRQLYNVVEGKEGRESAVFKATLKASKYMQAEASDGLDFASIDLLARRPTSMALLAVNVEDILRIASHKGALEKLREPANAQRANIAVSRLAHIAAQPEYPVQIRSAAVQTLSALGHAQMVQSVTVQSPFSFGYRRLPESEKGARSTHFALYAHSLHLLFYAALEAGANDVALCARDVLRVLLPNLADRKALSIDQSTHYAVFVDDLAGAVPPRSLYPRMPTDGILAGDCLSGSASKSRSQWLVQTYAALVPHTHSKVFQSLNGLIRLKPDLVEDLLPFLAYSALVPPAEFEGRSSSAMTTIAERNKRLFTDIFTTFFRGYAKEAPYAVAPMLRVLLFLRAQPQNGALGEFMSALDLLDVTKAALATKMYSTALLFFEQLNCSVLDLQAQASHLSSETSSIALEIFHNLDADNFDAMQLITAELSIRNPTELYRRFEHEQLWSKNLGLADISEEFPGSRGRARSLAGLGLFTTLKGYLAGESRHLDDYVADLQAEAAWRTGTWAGDAMSQDVNGSTFNGKIHTLMECIRSKTTSGAFQQTLNDVYRSCSRELSETGIDGWAKIQAVLGKSLLARETEELASVLGGKLRISDMIDVWRQRLKALDEDWQFPDIEPLLSARSRLLLLATELDATTGKEDLMVHLSNHLCDFVRLARKATHTQLAISQLGQLSHVLKSARPGTELASPAWSARLQLEEAETLWAWDERTLAIHALRKTAIYAEQEPSVSVAPILCLLGKYIGAERLQQPTSVIDQYLFKAAKAKDPLSQNSCKHALAEYADRQLAEFRASGRLEAARRRAAGKEEEVKRLEEKRGALQPKSAQHNDVSLRLLSNNKLLDQDKATRDSLEKEEKKYLDLAVKYYASSLLAGNEYDSIDASRFVSLWLAHWNSEDINEDLGSVFLANVQTRKFVGLVYQLSARLSNERNVFQNNLGLLLRRMARDHPFHTLPTLFALKNIADSAVPPEATKRAAAAKSVFDSLLSQNEVHKARVQQMNRLLKAYHDLALRNLRDTVKAGILKLPLKQEAPSLASIRTFGAVPVITRSLPVDPTCNYDSLISIQGFGGEIALDMGGVTGPKRITCIGSDGHSYNQLVKKDDVRQDAVFMNVFGVINDLLHTNVATRQRRLSIRTYKVIPISIDTGVLEWVDGSIPLGSWLQKAHPRYHPTDYAPEHCRKMMTSVREETAARKAAMLRKILGNFHPVLRHFFEETYQDPQEWFERRNAYTTSVATMSIVGWIVGLGDRHVNNMLLAKTSGELVQIDFGIAFETGTILAVPETVPFRLTQDIVDGFGLTGVEGLFRKSCEEVLKLLRSSEASNMVLTLLDVFRYDPLQKWSPGARATDKDKSEANVFREDQIGNVEAGRSIDTIRGKLSSPVSVTCQINELIQTASNVDLLAQLFHGWQPYL